MFFPKVGKCSGGTLKKGLYAGQAEGGSKFRGLREGEKLYLSWSSQGIKYFIQVGQWAQTVQVIIYNTKNGNLEGLCLALS